MGGGGSGLKLKILRELTRSGVLGEGGRAGLPKGGIVGLWGELWALGAGSPEL